MVVRTGAPAASAAARALPDCPRARAPPSRARPAEAGRDGGRDGGARIALPRRGHAHRQPLDTPPSLRRGRFTAVRGNRAAAVVATGDEAAGETQGDTGGDTGEDTGGHGGTWCR